MNIILLGFTFSGKSTVGQLLAAELAYHFFDADRLTESLFTQTHSITKTVSEIYRSYGEEILRDFETQALTTLQGVNHTVIALGGGGLLRKQNRELLKALGCRVYLHIDFNVAQERMAQLHQPAYLTGSDPVLALKKVYRQRLAIYEDNADIKIITAHKSPQELVPAIFKQVEDSHVRT